MPFEILHFRGTEHIHDNHCNVRFLILISIGTLGTNVHKKAEIRFLKSFILVKLLIDTTFLRC